MPVMPSCRDAALDALWRLLDHVRRIDLRVDRRTLGETTTLRGTADVRVERRGESLVWHERGSWATEPLRGVNFRNTTRWTCVTGSRVELSHLRRGAGQATSLVELELVQPGIWHSLQAHACGADRYLATVECRDDRLVLTWEVESPSDPYRLTIETHGLFASPPR